MLHVSENFNGLDLYTGLSGTLLYLVCVCLVFFFFVSVKHCNSLRFRTSSLYALFRWVFPFSPTGFFGFFTHLWGCLVFWIVCGELHCFPPFLFNTLKLERLAINKWITVNLIKISVIVLFCIFLYYDAFHWRRNVEQISGQTMLLKSVSKLKLERTCYDLESNYRESANINTLEKRTHCLRKSALWVEELRSNPLKFLDKLFKFARNIVL